INDLIMFDGNNVDEITSAFHNAIDDYLDFCAQRGKSPDQTFKGSFNVRTGPSVHRQAAIAAKKQGVSLNEFVTRAIERSLSNLQSSSPSVSPTCRSTVTTYSLPLRGRCLLLLFAARYP